MAPRSPRERVLPGGAAHAAGSRCQYDAGVAGDGVLIWRVVAGTPSPATHLGAPNLSAGGSGVWADGDTTPTLQWNDGSTTGVRLGVRRAGADLRMEWSSDLAPTGPDNFAILTYGGNGTTPVDSGLPRVGEIYGIKPDGPLLWYRYNGSAARRARMTGTGTPATP